MRHERNKQHIEDMKINCDKIIKITSNTSHEELMDNEILKLAIERLFEIVGEAANRIPKEYHIKYPNVEWSKAIGLRNVISHSYDKIDYEILLITALEDLPRLRKELDKIDMDNI